MGPVLFELSETTVPSGKVFPLFQYFWSWLGLFKNTNNHVRYTSDGSEMVNDRHTLSTQTHRKFYTLLSVGTILNGLE